MLAVFETTARRARRGAELPGDAAFHRLYAEAAPSADRCGARGRLHLGTLRSPTPVVGRRGRLPRQRPRACDYWAVAGGFAGAAGAAAGLPAAGAPPAGLPAAGLSAGAAGAVGLAASPWAGAAPAEEAAPAEGGAAEGAAAAAGSALPPGRVWNWSSFLLNSGISTRLRFGS